MYHTVPQQNRISMQCQFLFLFPLYHVPIQQPCFRIHSYHAAFGRYIKRPKLADSPPITATIGKALKNKAPLLRHSRRYQFIQFLLRLHISCDTIKSGHTIMRIPYLQRIPRHGDTALHVIQHHVQRNAVPPARIRKIEHQHIIPLIISPSGHTLYLHLLFLHGIKHIE